MKKLATWALAFVFVLSFALPQGTAFANSDAVTVYVDGVEVEGYEQAFVSHEQVLLPVEELFNEAGFKVSKDSSGAVNVSNTYLTVDFKASVGAIEINGKKADTKFPLTLQNYGNYISSDFLATLEGFEVEVSEDLQTVNVTTNRLAEAEVVAFLEKSSAAAADLKSVSTAMTIDMKMESSLEEEAIDMKMDMTMDQFVDPMSFYSLTKMSTNFAGEKIEDTSGMYLTEEGYFQQIGDVWVKYDDELTEGLLDITGQEDLLAQLEALQTKFTKGLNIYEYEDVYVMTQTISNEEFATMMEEVMPLLLGAGLTETTVAEDIEAVEVKATEEVIVEEKATEVEATEEVTTEEEATEEEATEEEATEEAATEEAATEEAATEEEAVELEDVDFAGLFEGLEFDIKEFYVTSTINKETLFPVDMSAIANISLTVDEDTITISLLLDGTFSDFNAVKEIKVPADVVKNAISMDEFMKIIEAELEKALAEEEVAA